MSKKVNLINKLFVFFGSDIEKIGINTLSRLYKKGFSLLPLDSPGIGFSFKANCPFYLIDDFIQVDELVDCKIKATHYETLWYKNSEYDFSIDGICWPKFDRYAMYHFWKCVTFTIKLAEKISCLGIDELAFCMNREPLPFLYYYPSDVHAVILSNFFSQKVVPIYFDKKINKKAERLLTTQKICFLDNSNNESLNISTIQDKVLITINSGEFYRFRPAIEQLYMYFPNKMASVLISPGYEKSIILANNISIPIISPIKSTYSNIDFEKKFINAYNKLVNKLETEYLKKIFCILKFHFSYYCMHRWPVLAQNFQEWSKLWTYKRPKALVLSDLDDSESQIPAEAAKRKGIPTFSIPHSLGRGNHYNISSYTLLASSILKHREYEQLGIPSFRIRSSQLTVATNEYISYDNISAFNKSKRVLILLDPVFIDNLVDPLIEPKAQIKAFDEIAAMIQKFSNNISFVVKVHPKNSDIDFIASYNPFIIEKMLPLEADLESIVNSSDIVIAVNYVGTAIYHVVRFKKPIIFFWNDLFYKEIDKQLLIVDIEYFFNAGFLVEKGDELCDALTRFYTDIKFAENLIAKVKKFFYNNFDFKNYSTVGEIVHQELLKNNNLPQDVTKQFKNELDNLAVNSSRIKKIYFEKTMSNKTQIEKGIDKKEIALEKDPDATELLNQKANLHIQKGNLKEGQKILLEILKKSPENVEALVNSGILEFQKGNVLHAIEFFRNALILDPNNKTAILYFSKIKNNSINKSVARIQKIDIDQLIPNYEAISVQLFRDIIDQEIMPLNDLIPVCKIVQNKNPKVIFEFATNQGSTAFHFAVNSQAIVYTFDLPPKSHEKNSNPKKADNLDVHPEKPGTIFHNTQNTVNINQIYGDSKYYDFSKFYNKADIVFVDSCHHFENVLKDSLNALKIIKTDGIIVWHDFASYAPGVLKALAEISTKFPLFHINKTNLVAFYGKHQPSIFYKPFECTSSDFKTEICI